MGDRPTHPQRGVKRSLDEHPSGQLASVDTVPLRTGQWTPEEIAFATKVIEYFDHGSLPNCTNGTTLRALLADILHCSPMRISKKFAGDGAIGKRTFTKHNTLNQSQLDELRSLEFEFHESIQGRARWPLVEWKTLLLGRGGESQRQQPPPPQQQHAPYPPRAQPTLGAPGPRPPWMVAPPPVPPPPRGGREVRHTLTKLKAHCAPITLERLEGQPTAAGMRGVMHQQPGPVQGPGAPEEGRRPEPPPPRREETAPGEHPAYSPQQRHADSAASMHAEVYGWVPSELGVPDTDPAALARILDAERDARPYTDDVARQQQQQQQQQHHQHHQHHGGIHPLQAPLIFVPGPGQEPLRAFDHAEQDLPPAQQQPQQHVQPPVQPHRRQPQQQHRSQQQPQQRGGVPRPPNVSPRATTAFVPLSAGPAGVTRSSRGGLTSTHAQFFSSEPYDPTRRRQPDLAWSVPSVETGGLAPGRAEPRTDVTPGDAGHRPDTVVPPGVDVDEPPDDDFGAALDSIAVDDLHHQAGDHTSPTHPSLDHFPDAPSD